jgi:hypothetical protein
MRSDEREAALEMVEDRFLPVGRHRCAEQPDDRNGKPATSRAVATRGLTVRRGARRRWSNDFLAGAG